MVPGQPLAASLLFAAEADRDAILVVRCLAGELLRLLDGPPEPSLLSARLGWWQSALGGQAGHPALSAWAAVVAGRSLGTQSAGRLLAGVAQAGQGLRFERFEELWSQCRALGGEAAVLEHRLNEPGTEHPEPALELGAAGWLLKRVRDIPRDAHHNRWLVPLDLQAQFQIARQDVIDERDGPGWRGLVQTLVGRAVQRGDAAAIELGPKHRHLCLHWAVERRLAAALAGRPQAIFKRRVLPGHAGNVWAAWRAARRLARRQVATA